MDLIYGHVNFVLYFFFLGPSFSISVTNWEICNFFRHANAKNLAVK